MSRGPGALQRDILAVVSGTPGGQIRWETLKRRFPVEVRHKTFYRAVRSLRRMRRLRVHVDGLRWAQATRPVRAGEVTYLCEEEVAELLASLPRPQRSDFLPDFALGELLLEERGGGESAAEVVAYRPIFSGPA